MNPISTSARLAKHAVRFTKYIATILVACAFSISAFAYTSTYPSMSFTGTHNGWAPGATPMTLYKTNSWHVIVDLQDGDEFKFTPYGDWSVSFGVNGGETNIVANQGSGTYRITFYDDTKNYVIERYTHAIGNQRIYFRTSSFANPKVHIWNAQPSGLYSNTTWPGVSMVHEGNDYYRYDFGGFDITSASVIFSDNGANQTANLSYSSANNCYKDGSWVPASSCGFEGSTPVNQAPSANAGADVTITEGDIVNFNGSGSTDPDGNISTYTWSNGLVGATPSRTYANAGSYTVTLTVTDAEGLSDTDTMVVTVEPPQVQGTTTLYFKNTGYTAPYMHYFASVPTGAIAGSTWPGVAMTNVVNGYYSVTINAEVTGLGVVFNDNGGAQTMDLTYDGTNDCYKDGTWMTLAECDINNVGTGGGNGGETGGGETGGGQNIPQIPRTAFVHLFEWTWKDIAIECEEFLGPKGFSAVQVSPPNEHINTQEWWARYQPVSYELTSRGGTRAEFIDMVSRCKAAGVDVYVDAVINHMAGGSGIGVAGSPYSAGQTYDTYSSQDFNQPACGIENSDYGNNAADVRNCALSGLPDLATGTEYVRNTIAAYLNDLIDIGVAGFRFDASKHMWPADIQAIKSRLNGNPYIFQEVIDQGGEAVLAGDYTGIGNVTEFLYSVNIGNTFKNGDLAWLSNFGQAWGMMNSVNAVVFTDNHDNQRGHGAGGTNILTFKDAPTYDLANIFMLAYPYGYPKVMSSYDFGSIESKVETDKGGPGTPIHNTDGTNNCFGDWKCEHRWQGIANMVAFRNHTVDAWSVDNWWDNGADQIAFGRGNKGYVVINQQGNALTRTFQTQLAPGSYCDVISGNFDETTGNCGGNTITVNADGTFNATIGTYDALAIHVGAITGQPTPGGHGNTSSNTGGGQGSGGEATTTQTIYFDNGQNYNIPTLHIWNAQPAGSVANSTWPGIAMTAMGDGWYQVTLSSEIESASVIFNDDGNVQTGNLSILADYPCYQGGMWVSLSNCQAPIVADQAPLANAGQDLDIGQGGQAILDGRLSSDDSNIISYEWSGDLGSFSGAVVSTTTLNTQGSYSVTLTVTDDAGQTDSDTIRVVVSAPRAINSRIVIEPELAFPVSGVVGGGDYAYEEAFPYLDTAFEPLVYVTNDGYTDRVFVVEIGGRIKVFPNDPNVQPNQVSTFLDITAKVDNDHERGLLGLAFDPDYATNGYFYVVYSSHRQTPGYAFGDTIVERYSVDPSNPNKALVETAFELLAEPQQGKDHKGGMAKFGPDGNLYVSMGDGQWSCGHSNAKVAECVDWGDASIQGNNNGQDLTTLRSTIMRIKPDANAPGGYTIPTDNPFVGNSYGYHEEIYAYGFRNPWRFDIDSITGELYVGDVGHETSENAYEEVNRVISGGNYGWPVCDGLQNRGYWGSDDYQNADCASDYQPPHAYYRHNGGAASVIGGVFYHGGALPLLEGKFIYGDYDTGKVWAVDSVGNVETVTSSFPERLAAFGTDLDGDVLAVSYNFEKQPNVVSKLFRLVDNDVQSVTIPTKLSETGLFSNTANLTPTPGVIEYDVNVAGWFDGLTARHFLALPGNASIDFSATGEWQLPVGTAVVKHLEVPTDAQGNATRFETSVLFRQTSGWIALNYKWNASGTDADLVYNPEQSAHNIYIDGAVETRVFTNRDSTQCATCHSNNVPLSVETRQLNRDFDYPTVTDNQLAALNSISLFNTNLLAPSSYQAYAAPADSSASLLERSKAYLDVNCAHCHANPQSMDLRYDTGLVDMNIVSAHTNIGSSKVEIFDPSASGLYIRQSSNNGRMPNGSSYTNEEAAQLMYDWIEAAGATVSELGITTDDAVVDLNDTVTLQAVAIYDNGFWKDYDGQVTWTTSDTGIINVAALSGPSIELTPLATGTVTISAEIAGLPAGTIDLRVQDAGAIVALKIAPRVVTLTDTYPLIAVAEMGDGSFVNVSASPDTSWSVISGAADVAVDASGHLSALSSEGEAVVQIDYMGMSATADVAIGGAGIWLRFNNPSNWSQVCVHTWNGSGVAVSTWPGATLTSNNGWYEYQVPSENLATDGSINAIFNNCGNGNKTDDLVNITEHTEFTGLTNADGASWAGNGATSSGDEYLLVTLNATQNNGSGDGTYTEGTIVTVTATVPPGQVFDHWVGDGVAYIVDNQLTEREVQVVMPNKGLTITPTFKLQGIDPTAEPTYASQCSSCHGSNGEGGVGPALNVATPATDTFDELVVKIRDTMPPSNPGSCNQDCAEILAAYIMIELRDTPLTCDQGPSTSPRLVRLLTRDEYVRTVDDLLGVTPVSMAAVPKEASVNGFVNNAETATVSNAHLNAYIALAEELVNLNNPINSTADIATFGKQAFRRPLTSAEISRYTNIFNTRGGAVTAQTILSSPNFLYRVEAGVLTNGNYVLDDYEVATLLSYMFWGTTPDSTLMAAADAGNLSTAAGVLSEAQRLSNDTRARETAGDFATQWLHVNGVTSVTRDDPDFINVANDMLNETRDFFSHVLFDSTSTYEELLTANYTIASDELAIFYGLSPGVNNMVSYSYNQRSGLLGHGSHLARNATFSEMHPVKRGFFVRNYLLCQELPQPEGIVVSFPEVDPTLTLRERFQVHTQDPICNECHQYIDGVGFGFSHFDKAGKWIDTENGLAIDATGDMNDVDGIGTNVSNPYNTLPELGQILANSQGGKSCFVKSYYRFAHGYHEKETDTCSLDTLSNKLIDGDITLKELLLELTQTNNFTVRQ